jgi:hypothetical protein
VNNEGSGVITRSKKEKAAGCPGGGTGCSGAGRRPLSGCWRALHRRRLGKLVKQAARKRGQVQAARQAWLV